MTSSAVIICIVSRTVRPSAFHWQVAAAGATPHSSMLRRFACLFLQVLEGGPRVVGHKKCIDGARHGALVVAAAIGSDFLQPTAFKGRSILKFDLRAPSRIRC